MEEPPPPTHPTPPVHDPPPAPLRPAPSIPEPPPQPSPGEPAFGDVGCGDQIEQTLDEALADSFPASDPVSIVTSQHEEAWQRDPKGDPEGERRRRAEAEHEGKREGGGEPGC